MRADRIPAGRGRFAALALAALTIAALLFGGFSSTFPPGSLPPVEAPFTIDDRGPAPPAPPSAGPRPGQPVMGGTGWRVVSSRSVQGILIVEVETAGALGGPDLAASIIGPARAGHLEALVYFRRPGERLADTRVQWTPAGGYVTLALR
ncbi:MAG: hypothetical protein OXH69_14260 [Acidobacteria bacterium]|nr:hypothetical protein [Acidobacteriota bacterium]